MLYQLKLTQPSPARSFVEALPRNRTTASRHEQLFRGVGRFLAVLLKQGTQIQFRPHFPVRENRERTIGRALQVPANDFAPVFTTRATFALSTTRATLAGRAAAARAAYELPPIRNSWNSRSIATREIA